VGVRGDQQGGRFETQTHLCGEDDGVVDRRSVQANGGESASTEGTDA
jgi:hypothetical protein